MSLETVIKQSGKLIEGKFETVLEHFNMLSTVMRNKRLKQGKCAL
jgi:hypothetical protein